MRTPDIAEVAIEAGADWLGLVLVPGSLRHADDVAARSVVAAVRGRVDLIGVMVDATREQCDDAARRYRLAAVQLHGTVAASVATEAAVPVIRAINAGNASAVFTDGWWPNCTILLDAAPAAHGDLPGGTGTRVDEAIAAELARHRRLVLAGGLSPGNVSHAIEAVRPYGVDASSGLELVPGVKDPALVVAFVHAARAVAVRE